jgi:hypothetical protein
MQCGGILKRALRRVRGRAYEIVKKEFAILIPAILHFVATTNHYFPHRFFFFDHFHLQRAVIIVADSKLFVLVARKRYNEFVSARV